MRREQVQVRVALGGGDVGDELTVVAWDGPEAAPEIAGIEATTGGPDPFLEAVVPDSCVSPPRRGSGSFRDGNARASREQVTDLLLGR